MDDLHFLSAREAAAELNVSRATLYAYVSRGLIRSSPGSGRSRLYRADDVRRLRQRKSPSSAAGGEEALPRLESAITLIRDDRLYFRGRDATALARSTSLESLASLLWERETAIRFPAIGEPPAAPPYSANTAIALLARRADSDPRGWNLSSAGVADTGARIVALIAHAFGAASGEAPLHERLAQGWHCPERAELLRAALVLSADHEFNASTFAVRVAAGTRANPYAATIAGLATLQGPRHGGLSARVATLREEIAREGDAAVAIGNRLRRGEDLPGFGHPLYRGGDPRARTLLALLDDRESDAIVATIGDLAGVTPNIDFALDALRLGAGLPEQAAFALFAVGRSLGWIAHAREQYRRADLIRPRARYVGEAPQGDHDNRRG